jgi:hypothetical protein
MYDLRNDIRKANEINDFDDEYSNEDEDVESDNQPHVPLVQLQTSRSILINSITTKTSVITTRTTTPSKIDNRLTEKMENKTSTTVYTKISSSSSSRLRPLFICLLLVHCLVIFM